MFAKAEWFTKGRRIGRVRPSTWRGRFYVVAWTAGLIVPALVLVNAHRVPEAGIWLALATVAWWLDFRPIRAAIWLGRPADVFVIDENTDITQLNTRNYDMSLRS
jgi:hypothetical protein